MGLQLSRSGAGAVRRSAASAPRRVALAASLGAALILLSGCSEETQYQLKHFGLPGQATEEAPHIADLWIWSWVAALATGILVWGLIFWVVVRYRRRSADEVPVQTRYNLPLEIFYTIAPVMMVIVFFFHTVQVQNTVLDDSEPDLTLEIVGQQWSWTFNYPTDGVGGGDREEVESSEYAYNVGTASQIPTLVLPLGETVRFNLHSPDVIHGFWIPGFLMKMDVVPGRLNHFQVTPTEEGTFAGKCTELCGVYHSRMLFNVEVVSPEEYDAYVEELAENGDVSANGPLVGGEDARTTRGLHNDDNGGSE
ncbi:cytochrome c oxidase subunit 2 [Nocardioides zeae]|uniref:cytochrome-c oxidase n=2 Tax=Nocardioides zeae TaxID=1457234 RepID=A0AAJ1TW98_9ACTN|nr:cytochrome c oxidase subunit II [Nocardioides zeae]MDQ1103190.1 cytochrome c oxidase subunit 2 [Nocardioides zeae]MDR6173092.1 cytochrome c oxidase subunit 2 [Nocardioides zeae]MDR6210085.1 cytochrome c oxidase subunit 2 [Nocardioides zeae]